MRITTLLVIVLQTSLVARPGFSEPNMSQTRRYEACCAAVDRYERSGRNKVDYQSTRSDPARDTHVAPP